MWIYIAKRLLLMVPTLLGILLVTFAIIQFVPGGPVEQLVQQLKGEGQVFGEVALLDGLPRTADATALEPSDILALDASALQPVPATAADEEHGFLSALATHEYRMVALIDVNRLFSKGIPALPAAA